MHRRSGTTELCTPMPNGATEIVRRSNLVGRLTLLALTAHPRGGVLALLGALHDVQAGYYRSLATFPTLGRGWLLRKGRRLQAAVRLAAG